MPTIITAEEHEARSLELLAQAEPLPLASSQRLARLVTAQVHAQLALLATLRAAQAPAKAPAKAATRKTAAKKSEPAQEAPSA